MHEMKPPLWLGLETVPNLGLTVPHLGEPGVAWILWFSADPNRVTILWPRNWSKLEEANPQTAESPRQELLVLVPGYGSWAWTLEKDLPLWHGLETVP